MVVVVEVVIVVIVVEVIVVVVVVEVEVVGVVHLKVNDPVGIVLSTLFSREKILVLYIIAVSPEIISHSQVDGMDGIVQNSVQGEALQDTSIPVISHSPE